MNKNTFRKVMLVFIFFIYLFAAINISIQILANKKHKYKNENIMVSKGVADEIINKYFVPLELELKEKNILIVKESNIINENIGEENKKEIIVETKSDNIIDNTSENNKKTKEHSTSVVSNNSTQASLEIASSGDADIQNTYIVDKSMYKVVEAETHGKGKEAKKRIVHVILNRVADSRFPNTISGVCNQKNQFAKRSNIENSTIEAVNEALYESDITNGALYFCTCKKGCWASKHATYLFTDEVGHNFYK